MTETEVYSIFVEQLTGHNTQDGIARTHQAISLHILEKMARPWAEPKNWELLKENAYAKSLLSIFLAVKPGQNIKASEVNLVQLIFIYKHWWHVLIYLDDNYETIDCLRFKKLLSPVHLSDLRKVLKDKYESFRRQFSEKRSIFFRAEEFPVADEMFNILYLVILGEDIFGQFLQECNQAFEIVRKYQTELVSIN